MGDYKLIRQRTEYKGKILKDKWQVKHFFPFEFSPNIFFRFEQEKHLINPSDVKRCTKQRHIKVVKATHTLLPHQDGLLSEKEEEELYEMLDMRARKIFSSTLLELGTNFKVAFFHLAGQEKGHALLVQSEGTKLTFHV